MPRMILHSNTSLTTNVSKYLMHLNKVLSCHFAIPPTCFQLSPFLLLFCILTCGPQKHTAVDQWY
ncbi:hypothetical protein RchiOBHm_Chr7g0235751 [Rosa chinensis]|uniref:Uncharacterized protein n=1 Tax=Rosa chinensis TaxID=74649 RepID=A0A2P6PGR9_ROSCH|nr:hypothetical protein RchiOBHm_Chr7g0235751 [Rosa chinensis]